MTQTTGGPSAGHRLEDWIQKLPKCERAIYERLLKSPATMVSKEELGQELGYSPNSGGFNGALGKLSTLGLIVRGTGGVQINPELADL